jgi:hypothetical protein
LFNVSPAHVFDDLLTGGSSRGRVNRDGSASGGDWYAEVAPAEQEALYEIVRRAVAEGADARAGTRRPPSGDETNGRSRPPVAVSFPGLDAENRHREAAVAVPVLSVAPGGEAPLGRDLPPRASDLSADQRDALGRWLRGGWPGDAREAYARLSAAVASASVARWEAALAAGRGAGEAMLWRLLRVGSAPYFVLGSSAARSLRLRIATSWDWRQRYALHAFTVTAQAGGQPRVGWAARVRDRATHETHEVMGHIEVRWSHGRFGGLPEAKGYLDTPHHLVPGYFPLT